MRLRQAVRALVFDPDDRILLDERRTADGGTLWATPGGGIDVGESHEHALRRELAEELGLDASNSGPRSGGGCTCFLCSASKVSASTSTSCVSMRSSRRADRTPTWWVKRWWTLAELEVSDDLFAPRRLPELVAALLRDGPPGEPVDVGV